MKHKLPFLGLLLYTAITFGQNAGNQVLNRRSYTTEKPQTATRLYLSDSTFLIEANVVAHLPAESYVATFAVSQAGTNAKEANTKIDERIQRFIAALTTNVRIQPANIYVDRTTQTQLADYKANGNYAEQMITGIEQKKNVIVHYQNPKDLDRMVLAAAENGIFDLAKIDYVIADPSKPYTQLFEAAMEVINRKKALYEKATNSRTMPSSEIYGESFYRVSPEELYQQYTPAASTEYYDNSTYARRKDLRLTPSFFYDHLNYSGFDKVINPVVTEPPVAFVLRLQVKFSLDRNAR